MPTLATSHPSTFCNPINVGYRYQEGYHARSAADSALVLFRGDYYLFASRCSGYWWSSDLADWQFVYISRDIIPHIEDWAPAACVVDDTLYLTHCGGHLYRSTDPKAGLWDYVGCPYNWYDPALFVDDDGRAYCYHGCSPVNPLYAMELDPAHDFALLGEPVPCFQSDPAHRGFEVRGDAHTRYEEGSWLEGAWVLKHEGRYYLQYSVPGTQFVSYSDGCAVSDSPMGPFVYCENSPFTYKASGFVVGSGHGSLLCDRHGRFWKCGTAVIAVNTGFERRLTLVPFTFNEEGQMAADLAFSDYPLYHAGVPGRSFENSRPHWHLVSYGAAATASSSLEGHPPVLAFDESMRTWWSAQTGEAGEWLAADLGKTCRVQAIQLNFADQDVGETSYDREEVACYRYRLEISESGTTWQTVADCSEAEGRPSTAADTSHDYFELCRPVTARYVRVTNCGPVPAGGKFAVSGLRMFGHGGGEPPEPVTDFRVERSSEDGHGLLDPRRTIGRGCHPLRQPSRRPVSPPSGNRSGCVGYAAHTDRFGRLLVYYRGL